MSLHKEGIIKKAFFLQWLHLDIHGVLYGLVCKMVLIAHILWPQQQGTYLISPPPNTHTHTHTHTSLWTTTARTQKSCLEKTKMKACESVTCMMSDKHNPTAHSPASSTGKCLTGSIMERQQQIQPELRYFHKTLKLNSLVSSKIQVVTNTETD